MNGSTVKSVVTGEIVRAAVEAALGAGDAIMGVYARAFDVEVKEDRSPVTEADCASNTMILARLRETGLPMLSEESAPDAETGRRAWLTYWLIDPLDGTKEFIHRNGDFTVNIALICDGRPAFGVVYIPAQATLYLGAPGIGSFRAMGTDLRDRAPKACASFPHPDRPFHRLGPGTIRNPVRVVVSRSHATPETDSFIHRLEAAGFGVERVPRGSALKLCLVAAGEADIYPRLGPTMEWDTAAAQSVVEGAGGRVLACDTATHRAFLRYGPAALRAAAPLSYNRAELRNPWFVALHSGWTEP